MGIDYEPSLDFKDVLLRPKRWTLGSRANVDLVREYRFRYAPLRRPSVPIIAANMDTVGTFAMARALAASMPHCALHKHHPLDELVAFFSPDNRAENQYTFYSLGILESDLAPFE